MIEEKELIKWLNCKADKAKRYVERVVYYEVIRYLEDVMKDK